MARSDFFVWKIPFDKRYEKNINKYHTFYPFCYYFMINQKKFALLMWVLIGGIHFLWALWVAFIPTTFQNFLNRIFWLHFIQPYWIITPFNFGKMIILVIFTFIVGLILWRLIGLILNSVMVKKK